VPELIHTCYRVTDLERSVSFYEALGFEEVGRLPIRDEAINVFMGLPGDGPRLELTYNHDQDGPYELGSGYGHIAITTDDVDGALERLAAQGIEPERPPYTVSENGPRLCFVRDPDGYRVEVIETGGG
jgi:lactoylglutathione lyase